mgnify:CR=1 FL=1
MEPQLVRAGAKNPESVHTQLRRWSNKGKLVKLARGKYVIAKPYRKRELPVEYLANQIVYPSYLSLEYALDYHNLIPETAQIVTSLTTARPQQHENPEGRFHYRHVKEQMFWGYYSEALNGLEIVLAEPEKALLDTFYFWSGPVTHERIEGLRLQNLDKIDPQTFSDFAERTGSKKLLEGSRKLLEFRTDFLEEYDLNER